MTSAISRISRRSVPSEPDVILRALPFMADFTAMISGVVCSRSTSAL